ncbi:MAG TPA: GNAT family N-acetyltransferase [Gaiellaceae bacterium]
MSIDVRRCASLDELRRALDAISHYFGNVQSEEDAEQFAQWIDVERMHAAWDGDAIVGGAGAFAYSLSVPGGSVPAAGVTVVGVLPTHRRRGVLTSMMRAQLDDCRERGEPVAYLWASEDTIYGRFGYGIASRAAQMTLARERTAFREPFAPRGTVRLVGLEEAAVAFPPLYERMLAQRPGLTSRTDAWWRTRRLKTGPRSPAPKNLALLELDGDPAAYAIYTVKQDWRGGSSAGTVEIVEAVAPEPAAARELWRWLLDFDWTSEFVARLLPVDHELHWLLAEPRRMQLQVADGVWVRLVDVGAALAARTYEGDAEVVLEVADAFLPENAGRWRVSCGGVERTTDVADLAVDVSVLGSVYLGGFSFAELARGLRVEELRDGAVGRADALFRTRLAPWCAEIF